MSIDPGWLGAYWLWYTWTCAELRYAQYEYEFWTSLNRQAELLFPLTMRRSPLLERITKCPQPNWY